MKIRKLVLILMVLCIFSSSISKSQAVSIVGNEYRFVTTYDRWWQLNDGDKIENFIEFQYKYEILDYDNESIILKYTYGVFAIETYNFTYWHSSYSAPIGLSFLIPSLFTYYYDMWVNTEDIYDVNLAAPVGTNHTKDVRTASNYIFEGEFEGYLSNVSLGFEYDSDEEQFISIFGEEYSEAILLVQYDPDGVILKIENEFTRTNSLLVAYEKFTLERVDEFPEIEGTSYAIIGIITIVLLAALKIRKRKSGYKEKT